MKQENITHDRAILLAAASANDYDTTMAQLFALLRNGHYDNSGSNDDIRDACDLLTSICKFSHDRQVSMIMKLGEADNLQTNNLYFASAVATWVSVTCEGWENARYNYESWPKLNHKNREKIRDEVCRAERMIPRTPHLSPYERIDLLAVRHSVIREPEYHFQFAADVDNAIRELSSPMEQMAAIDRLIKKPYLQGPLQTRLCRTAVEHVLPCVRVCAQMARRDYVEMIDFATGLNQLLENGHIAPTLRPEFTRMAHGFLDVVIDLAARRDQFPLTHTLIDLPNANAALAALAPNSMSSARRGAGSAPQAAPQVS